MDMQTFAAGLRELAPKVVQRDGFYVLEYADPANAEVALRQWAEEYPTDSRMVEIAFNHCHVVSLIPWLEGLDAASLLEIGRVYIILLEHELRRAFPGQAFEVIVDGDNQQDIEQDPNAYQVTFCRGEGAQKRRARDSI